MDTLVTAVLIVIALIALLRLRRTFRRSSQQDRGDEIQRKLAELRKKRDED
ncbi:hypothetical protein PAECIP111802_03896 [Paenibacillus allorhizosphaerae]|uniref:DUF4083 domain-containing protein n=1 Tax=Paenibacillus allorhizosphaerae TaxID=2849866 RepID=A0ABN7TMF8_9BACL|nr:hypothetical protein PAECIP111802_03896 [Paenibacillus allorhizosphaerae]